MTCFSYSVTSRSALGNLVRLSEKQKWKEGGGRGTVALGLQVQSWGGWAWQSGEVLGLQVQSSRLNIQNCKLRKEDIFKGCRCTAFPTKTGWLRMLVRSHCSHRNGYELFLERRTL